MVGSSKRAPSNRFRSIPARCDVADLVGLNFYKGNADKGMVTVLETGASLFVAEADLSGPVLIVIDPKAVMLQTESLSTERKGGSVIVHEIVGEDGSSR